MPAESQLNGAQGQEFGRLRRMFWPIHSYELKKIIPMLLMFFFISLIYSLLRNTKDTLIVTAPGGGADLIPFLKIYGVIPASILYMLVFAKLSNVLDKRTLFVVAMVPFILYFGLFAVLFPVRESIQPVAWAARWHDAVPMGLEALVAMARHWTFSLFYIMAELWGSVALSLLFWGFANDIVRVEESKRFYALFGIGANLALVAVRFANQFVHFLERHLVALRPMANWTAYVILLMALVVLCISVILGIYRWINRRVLTDPRFYSRDEQRALHTVKPKLSLGQAFRLLLGSRYLGFMAILVVGYGIAINLIEVTWKTHLGRQCPNPQDYQDYMANFSLATGIVTVALMLFVTNNVIRRFGWTVTALITPVVLLVTGAGFFGFLLFEGTFAPLLAEYGTSPMAMAVLFGTIQNVMSKSSKYSLFDPTKEMAYIPLDQESKVKGKAAIDVVGARLGKAGGSVIQQGLIGIYHTLQAIPAQIATILFLVIGIWIWATLRLGRSFTILTRQKDSAPDCQQDGAREGGPENQPAHVS